MSNSEPPSVLSCLAAGGFAGMVVDVSLYPLDTLKSRLQASQGFAKAGGFKDVYRGIQYVAAGSVPAASLFFLTYDYSKHYMLKHGSINGEMTQTQKSFIHLTAASLGEIAACTARVPVENLKLRNQTAVTAPSFNETLKSLCRDIQISRGIAPEAISNKVTPGVLYSALYRGFFTTVLRDVPFAMIQFPIYERMKEMFQEYRHKTLVADPANRGLSPEEIYSKSVPTVWQSALSGCLSGSVAAALTTPLDVVKTRLMLGKDSHGHAYTSAQDAVKRIYKEGGAKMFFSGIVPRIVWISMGGAVFLGAYDFMSKKMAKLSL